MKETTAQDMIRLTGLQWQIRKRGSTKHLNQASQHLQTAKHHFWKAQNKTVVQRDGKKDAHYRKYIRNIAARTKPWTVETWPQVDLSKPTK